MDGFVEVVLTGKVLHGTHRHIFSPFSVYHLV